MDRHQPQLINNYPQEVKSTSSQNNVSQLKDFHSTFSKSEIKNSYEDKIGSISSQDNVSQLKDFHSTFSKSERQNSYGEKTRSTVRQETLEVTDDKILSGINTDSIDIPPRKRCFRCTSCKECKKNHLPDLERQMVQVEVIKQSLSF